eukprot:scaffold12235_cov117-Isochrysis_galbana.AAC.3
MVGTERRDLDQPRRGRIGPREPFSWTQHMAIEALLEHVRVVPARAAIISLGRLEQAKVEAGLLETSLQPMLKRADAAEL